MEYGGRAFSSNVCLKKMNAMNNRKFLKEKQNNKVERALTYKKSII